VNSSRLFRQIIAPLFFGWAFDSIGVSSPYFFSSGILLATISLGFGLDQYARPGIVVAPEASINKREA
jgi:hypothetical protein